MNERKQRDYRARAYNDEVPTWSETPIEKELPYQLIGALGGAMNSEMGMLATQLMGDHGAETVDDIRSFLKWPDPSENDPQKQIHYIAIDKALDRLVSAKLAKGTPLGPRYQGNSYKLTPVGRNIGTIFAGKGLDFHSRYDITARQLYSTSLTSKAESAPTWVDTPYGSIPHELNQAEIRARLLHQLAIAGDKGRLPMGISELQNIPLLTAKGKMNHLEALQEIDLATVLPHDPNQRTMRYELAALAKWSEGLPPYAPGKLKLSREAYYYIAEQALQGNFTVSPQGAEESMLAKLQGEFTGNRKYLQLDMNKVFRFWAEQGLLKHPVDLLPRETTVTVKGNQLNKIKELINHFRSIQTGDSNASQIGAAVLKDADRFAIIKGKIEEQAIPTRIGVKRSSPVVLYTDEVDTNL